MRPPEIRLYDEAIADLFAGGGGTSTGIESALGRSPDVAINHNAEALAMHAANHPNTRHLCESVHDVDPREALAGKQCGLMWLSPDCTYHSKARGGKPHRDRDRARRIRGLAWIAHRWAKTVRPRVICVENVEELQQWGPLGPDNQPDPSRRGETFARWVNGLRKLGYVVEWRELRACDYGAPTSRKRLFIVARCDGMPIVWPVPTHGRGRPKPYRTAAECIDWSIPCPSIFDRKKPLAENTLRRIARGIRRFVIESPAPFIVRFAHGEQDATGKRRGKGEHSLGEPLPTVATSNEFGLVAPTLIQTSYGEREGQAPRILDLHQPLGTVVAGGVKHSLVAAFLARHFGGHENDGAQMGLPMHTITTQDHHALVTSHLLKFQQNSVGQDVRQPIDTLMAGATRFAEVRAFLVKFYGATKDGQQLGLPMSTVTTKDRFGLVTVEGFEYVIVDIGMRMLTPRELFNAQGFPPEYRIDVGGDGRRLTKTAQTRMCGNSVSPPMAAAVVRAQMAGAMAVSA